ncbi:MAG TPA: DNA-binding protein WhiA [Symbiobacteriaceae bacterium]
MADAFYTQVKDELAHLMPAEQCCRRTELAALLRACGRISIGGAGRLGCSFTTDHAPVARKILRMVKSEFGLTTRLLVARRRRLRKNLVYLVRVPPQPGLAELLQASGVTDGEGNLSDWSDLKALEQDHCRRSYLRGTFLGTGWVASPERQHHLEMTTTATEAADELGQLLFRYGIPVRMAYRKDVMVLYIKDGNHIAKFLNVAGAHQSLMHFEDVRAMKEMKNLVNRQVNAETANLGKTVEASARQVAALERLQAGGGLERLNEGLQELATLRLNHPDASLKELGEMCHPPLGKSGVNHRMRLLMNLAGDLSE